MKRTFVLLSLCAASLMAQQQRSDLVAFLALMQPSNEVPAINDTSSGTAIIWAHVANDGTNVLSASVDFNISTKFSGAVTVTGLHIHNAAAGVAGPIVIPTDVNGTTNSIAIDAAGKASIAKQVQSPSGNAMNAVILDMINHPENYYVNIHTTVSPGGAMRGQLLKADMSELMGMMSPKNEVPANNTTGSGIASVLLLRGRDATGKVAAATAIFDLIYTGFDPSTIFTGFHIHDGAAGINGPVIINSGLSGTNTLAVDPSGSGHLNFVIPMTSLDASFAAEMATANDLTVNPRAHYINIHTTTFGGGIMRDQMRPVESSSIQVNMQPSNETPPIAGLTASAPAQVPVLLIRNADGSIAAGTIVFDVNFRGFPASTTFTGLHLHTAAAGVAGPVVISSGLDANANKVVSDTGSGNVFRAVTVADTAGIAALNSLVKDPSGLYINLHTTVNPGGAIRDQLATPLGKPAVTCIAATSSPVLTAAPGAIISVYGTNLAGFSSGLDGFAPGSALANSMNGVSVTVGGKNAPFYYVSPVQLNVQVPFEVANGSQPVVVTTPAGASTASNITVADSAPSIVVVGANNLGAVTKNVDFSLVSSSNPAKAGDVIVVFTTGLGQTTAPLSTGAVTAPPTGTFNNTATATATIGGVNAPVAYSIASPGFVGLYQTAITVPAGVTGSQPLVLTIGGTKSNSVNLAVSQ